MAHARKSASSSFAYTPLGGGGGGGGNGGGAQLALRATNNRMLLEQAIGAAVLDRWNGYPVRSIAQNYKDIGGDNKTTIAVLERAFGDDFDAVANQGRAEVKARATVALADALASEGLRLPTTKEFRDLAFHVESDPGKFRDIVLNLP